LIKDVTSYISAIHRVVLVLKGPLGETIVCIYR